MDGCVKYNNPDHKSEIDIQNKGNLNTALSVLQIRSESNIKINKKLLEEEEQ